MKLSVIIVNYNVRYFLQQCLTSVQKAMQGMDGEIFVVDNCSSDDSLSMLSQRFPQVRVLANRDNPGFARANNQAIALSSGQYVLLLNPDTLVAEDALRLAVGYMEAHPDCGGLGVKMTDGRGRFLRESKRGLPTPMVSFFKAFGLSALFPQSRLFGRYHLGFLDENEIHEVDILAGAFMMMRREALDKVGLLDEAFFMYGEDIDLSYRLLSGGYRNVYFPVSRILHYKGESTKKGSLNYLKVFYQAMIIFARKHYHGSFLALYLAMIHVAVFLRAGMSAVAIFLRKIYWKALLALRRLFSWQRPRVCLLVGNEADRPVMERALDLALARQGARRTATLYSDGFDQMEAVLERQEADEIVFSDRLDNYKDLILCMEKHASRDREYKIVHVSDKYLVGSNLVLNFD